MPLQDVDLLSPGTFAAGPPYALLAQLRRESPVFWHARRDLPPFWVLTRHADVVAVSRDPATYSSAAGGVLLDERPRNVRADGRRTMNNLDGPEHARLRAMVGRS